LPHFSEYKRSQQNKKDAKKRDRESRDPGDEGGGDVAEDEGVVVLEDDAMETGNDIVEISDTSEDA